MRWKPQIDAGSRHSRSRKVQIHEFLRRISLVDAGGEDTQRSVAERPTNLEVLRIAATQITDPAPTPCLLHHRGQQPDHEMTIDALTDVKAIGEAPTPPVGEIDPKVRELSQGPRSNPARRRGDVVEANRHHRTPSMVEGGQMRAGVVRGLDESVPVLLESRDRAVETPEQPVAEPLDRGEIRG